MRHALVIYQLIAAATGFWALFSFYEGQNTASLIALAVLSVLMLISAMLLYVSPKSGFWGSLLAQIAQILQVKFGVVQLGIFLGPYLNVGLAIPFTLHLNFGLGAGAVVTASAPGGYSYILTNIVPILALAALIACLEESPWYDRFGSSN